MLHVLGTRLPACSILYCKAAKAGSLKASYASLWWTERQVKLGEEGIHCTLCAKHEMEKQLLQTVRLQVMQKYFVGLMFFTACSHSRVGTTVTLTTLNAGF